MLFVCDRCHSLENTALGHYWMRQRYTNEALCSACTHEAVEDGRLPEHCDSHGGWHGEFPRMVVTTKILRDRKTEFVDSFGKQDVYMKRKPAVQLQVPHA